MTGISSLQLSRKSLSEDGFKEYYLKWLTRKVDAEDAAIHFRALVEGAAELALRATRAAQDEEDDDDKKNQGVTNPHLEEMADTKGRSITEIFIYARDLRRVMVTYS
eukprot:CAMPEP_0197398468 /NCGR_PEP_ID=MMETSP1165-20131217/13442_1 /TAXON_ID=284809 /ORGANISM="Chrysocystis fragilis, Strain CCMP3189" /LENGTH=106 /DNA_ID=CAMNT_0042924421 /DNA_START=16 /DNA_END=332 /DNA_ORIENTATION=+